MSPSTTEKQAEPEALEVDRRITTDRAPDNKPVEPKPIAITQVAHLTPPVLAYPAAARRAQEQGRVDVRALVDVQGLRQGMAVVRSSGHARLDEAAIAAVRRTPFRPHRENGTPIALWVVMPLIFELDV